MSTKYIPQAESFRPKLSIVEGAKVYAKLKQEVTRAGILDRDYTYYAFMTVFAFGGLFLSAYLIYITSSPPLIALLGLFFAFFAVQVTGIFHDAGHRAIFKSVKNNDIFGYFCCALMAYTYKKWKINHNKHHANPNNEDMDPDIDRPMFAFNENQLKTKRGFLQFLSKNQVYFYYPIGTLTGIYSQLASVFYFIKESKKTKSWEKAVYLVGIVFWLILPFIVFSFGKSFLVYFSVYPFLGLYLFNVFAPNHKGMPQIKSGQKISFLEHQVIATRNIKGGFFTDMIFLGLNYQIEHLLFPHCPRNKLKLLTPYVKEICRETGLEYTQTGIIKSNKIILQELSRVALVG